MSHYRVGDRVLGWGPTVTEIDQLSSLFGEVRHLAVLHEGDAPRSALPYNSRKVALVPVRPSGGNSIASKIGVLVCIPDYLRTIIQELENADVVHVRCPANIGLLAIAVLAVIGRPASRWIKYAGNWGGYPSEPLSYRLQRWLLRKGVARGVVTVNGGWPEQGRHVKSFFNPCLDDEDLARGAEAARGKRLSRPIRLLFVGRVDTAKGADRAVRILASLSETGVDARLDLAGDGDARLECESLTAQLGLSKKIHFHGWLPRPALNDLYASAHFVVLPSRSEGWPKALSEGMAFGAIPIVGAVSSIPQVLQEVAAGRAIDPNDIAGMTEAIAEYVLDEKTWKQESDRGVGAAENFTYGTYLRAVQEILELNA